MSNSRKVPGPPPDGWACLQCVAALKQMAANGTPAEELPQVNLAVTLAAMPTPAGVCAVPTCYEHIAIVRQSPLVHGNGLPPAGLLRGRG